MHSLRIESHVHVMQRNVNILFVDLIGNTEIMLLRIIDFVLINHYFHGHILFYL